MVPSSRVLFSLGASNITTVLQREARVAACLWRFVFVHSPSFHFCIPPLTPHWHCPPHWKCIYLGAITDWRDQELSTGKHFPGTASINLLDSYEWHSKLVGPHFGDLPACYYYSPGGRHARNPHWRPWVQKVRQELFITGVWSAGLQAVWEFSSSPLSRWPCHLIHSLSWTNQVLNTILLGGELFCAMLSPDKCPLEAALGKVIFFQIVSHSVGEKLRVSTETFKELGKPR